MGAQDELEALRRRAYGPTADIDGDPSAIERLRALEEAERPHPPVVHEAPAEPAPPVVRAAVAEQPEDEAEPPPPRYRAVLASAVAALGRVRRSTWLIVAGFAALAAVLLTVLVVVQRVQTDPLGVGAVQVARLSVDTDFEVPELYFGGDAKREPEGFQEFHGLRTILTSRTFFNGGGSTCISVYSEDDIEITPNSFSGQILGGCAAGGFPAAVQFGSDIDGFPEELFSAFPGDALQFVYDEKNNEVVVFADNG